MSKLRIATFNVENLLQRFDFHRYGELTPERPLRILGVDESARDYFSLRRSLHVNLTDDSRQMTAQAIRDTQADIICLQEVDNRSVLDRFHHDYLSSAQVRYGWRRLLEGNDPRGIDVCVMSKDRIEVKSHAHHTYGEMGLYNCTLRDAFISEGDRIFRRDCLEVRTTVGESTLTVFVCHFKSLSGGKRSRALRRAEAEAVRKIIECRYPEPAKGLWLVVGDLNDYLDNDAVTPDHSLAPLLGDGFSENLVARRDVDDRWTHYYPPKNSWSQLDYILASPAVAKMNPDTKPDIIRSGLPYRVPGLECHKRYPRVGFDRPKASDHCPVVTDVVLDD